MKSPEKPVRVVLSKNSDYKEREEEPMFKNNYLKVLPKEDSKS